MTIFCLYFRARWTNWWPTRMLYVWHRTLIVLSTLSSSVLNSQHMRWATCQIVSLYPLHSVLFYLYLLARDMIMFLTWYCITKVILDRHSVIYLIVEFFHCPQDNIHLIIDHANTNKPNVRQAVANEQPIEELVAPQVCKYITEQYLYKEYEKEIECSHLALQS